MTLHPAKRLARQVTDRQLKVVIAESCTAGEVASQIGRVPGASRWWCGSCVTYRSQTKHSWLAIGASELKRFSAESPETTSAMVHHVLRMTPEADVAGAITGHLGPDAPVELDGLVFTAVGGRGPSRRTGRHRLTAATRRRRQIEAAHLLLDEIVAYLSENASFG